MNATPLHGLRTAIYFVTDIAAAKAWYNDALSIEPYFDEPYYVGYNVGGYELGLHPADAPPNDNKNAVAVYWGVDNVQDTYDMLLQKGASPLEEPNEVGGGIVVGMVKDPWGNGLGFIYNPHFSLAVEE